MQQTLKRYSVALVLLTCVGCGSSAPRVMLQGQVTIDGEVVEHGMIRFVCKGEPVTAMLIEDGRYNTADIPERAGLTPGTYRVEIQIFERITPDDTALHPPGVTARRIASTHEQALQILEHSPTTSDFHLNRDPG